jgi:hypothetical protein
MQAQVELILLDSRTFHLETLAVLQETQFSLVPDVF